MALARCLGLRRQKCDEFGASDRESFQMAITCSSTYKASRLGLFLLYVYSKEDRYGGSMVIYGRISFNRSRN